MDCAWRAWNLHVVIQKTMSIWKLSIRADTLCVIACVTLKKHKTAPCSLTPNHFSTSMNHEGDYIYLLHIHIVLTLEHME